MSPFFFLFFYASHSRPLPLSHWERENQMENDYSGAFRHFGIGVAPVNS